MANERKFINRTIFDELMAEVTGIKVESYSETETAYGDMSRLVVALLARTPPEELKVLYNDLGWKGNSSVHPIHSAAKLWMEKYRPQDVTQDG